MRTSSLRLVALVLPILFAATARAEDEGAAEARKAAAKVRASLPDPKDAGPFVFEGDLMIAGEKAGTVRYSAEPAVHEGQSVWEVAEDVAQEFNGAKARSGVTLTLARDLTMLGGEITRRTVDDFVRVKFTREGGQFAIDRTVSGVDKPNPESSKLSVDAPADATYGNTALALFLRHAPKKASARYAVSWFAPDMAGLKRGDHDPAPSTEARIEVLGGASFEASGQPCPTWAALVEHDGRTRELHFAPDDRAMIGILGRVPPVHVVPKGTAPPATKSDVDAPANSWRAAFLKFGRGYHMAVEEWLDAAFHWPSFYEYETSLPGGWPKEKPLDEFKKAWIAEFLKNSKHRPRSQADQLLQGTLMTGTVKEETGDKVVFAAHPEYGGGVQRTYHFAKVDGVWYLTRIDEAQ